MNKAKTKGADLRHPWSQYSNQISTQFPNLFKCCSRPEMMTATKSGNLRLKVLLWIAPESMVLSTLLPFCDLVIFLCTCQCYIYTAKIGTVAELLFGQTWNGVSQNAVAIRLIGAKLKQTSHSARWIPEDHSLADETTLRSLLSLCHVLALQTLPISS